MKHPILIISAFLIFNANLITAQTVNTDSANIAWHIYSLAHDSMQGRNAGSREEAIAANYIATQFELYGLKPYTPVSENYYVPYEFGQPTFKKCSLSVNGTQYRQWKDFGATGFSASGSVKGILVSEIKFSEKTSKSGNYIPLVDLYQLSKNENSYAIDVITLTGKLTDQGAKAIIFYNSGGYDKKQQLFSADSIPEQKIPILYIERNLARKLKKLNNSEVEIATDIKRNFTKTADIAGFIDNGSDKTVVVGAHYDHVGYNARGKDKGLCNGADDNASGTAAMLELARWAASRSNLKFNYLFIAFSAEEQGLFGSKHWCNIPQVKNTNYYWMMNLDMVGRLNWNGKNDLTVMAYKSAREWKNILPGVKHGDFDVQFMKGAPPFSDHAPFLENKVPVVYLTTGLPPEYHNPSDDPEIINYAGEAAILQYMRNIVLEIEKTDKLTFNKITAWQNTTTGTRIFLFK